MVSPPLDTPYESQLDIQTLTFEFFLCTGREIKFQYGSAKTITVGYSG